MTTAYQYIERFAVYCEYCCFELATYTVVVLGVGLAEVCKLLHGAEASLQPTLLSRLVLAWRTCVSCYTALRRIFQRRRTPTAAQQGSIVQRTFSRDLRFVFCCSSNRNVMYAVRATRRNDAAIIILGMGRLCFRTDARNYK